MRAFGQCRRRRLLTCLMTVRTSLPLGGRAQDRRHQHAARRMRVPECKLLAAMRGAERVVDISTSVYPFVRANSHNVGSRAGQAQLVARFNQFERI